MDFPQFVALVVIMGMSVFLSLPIVLRRSAQARTATILGAVAIGILIFLLADIFSNVATVIYAGSTAYLSNPGLDTVFVIGVVAAFLFLYFFEGRSTGPVSTPRQLALIIAIGMAFQNLTEGLVFGVAWSSGAVGLEAVIFLGFVIQNITEGIPIGAPFFATNERPAAYLAALFFVAGITTVIGGLIGFFYSSTTVEILFDALAIGAILYVLVPMLRNALRPLATREESRARDLLVYLGLLGGFVLGFLVNAI